LGRKSYFIIDKSKVLKYALSGITIKELAVRFEVTSHHIRHILKKYPDVWEKVRERRKKEKGG